MVLNVIGTNFVLNEKCISFSVLMVMFWLFAPFRDIKGKFVYFAAFCIFFISYVWMAWYDYHYKCMSEPLQKGKYSLTGLFKPPSHSDKQDPDKHSKHKMPAHIYWFHLLIIFPILIYLTYYKNNSNIRIYPLIGVISIFTLLYHANKINN
jgi:amino acid transporter